MNSKSKDILKKLNFTIITNIFSLLSTGIITLIVPKVFNQVEYGYWQLYIFYSSYVGFFHLGLQDGIYLRYGGQYYQKLDKHIMHSQLMILFFIQLVEASIIYSISTIVGSNGEKNKIVLYFIVMMILYLPNTHLAYVLQMTMRIKEYCIAIIIEKSIYAILVFIVIISKICNYEWLLGTDIFAKTISLIYIIFVCKDIVFQKGIKFTNAMLEAILNIRVGAKLLLANIASMLITGIARFSIEYIWGITIFGNVSLVFSLCNFFLIFVTAIGQVIFPLLKRISKERLPKLYESLTYTMTIFLIICLIMYQPIKELLNLWLPQYSNAMTYFVYLLPMCVFECKVSMIINTYYKALRMENLLLKINIVSVFISIIYTYIAGFNLHNLELTILGITFVSLIRCVSLEIIISKTLNLQLKRIIISETSLMLFFILINSIISKTMWSFILYVMSILIYCIIEFQNLTKSFKYLCVLIRNKEE